MLDLLIYVVYSGVDILNEKIMKLVFGVIYNSGINSVAVDAAL